MVKLVGSYADLIVLGLIMRPVDDRNLLSVSRFDCDGSISKEEESHGFFGCLVAALAHIHNNGILHKDIKPNNVFNKGGQILFTDIGKSISCFDTCAETTEEPKDGKSEYWSSEAMAGAVVPSLAAVIIQSHSK